MALINIEIIRDEKTREKLELRRKGQHVQLPSQETGKDNVTRKHFVVVRALGRNAGGEVYHIDPSFIPNPSNPTGRIPSYVFEQESPVRHIIPGEAWDSEVTVDGEGEHQVRISSEPYDLSG